MSDTLPKFLLAIPTPDSPRVWVVHNHAPRFIAEAVRKGNHVRLNLAVEIEQIDHDKISNLMREAAEYVQGHVSEPVRSGNFSYVTGNRPEVPDLLFATDSDTNYFGVISTKFPPAIMTVEQRGPGLLGVTDFNCARVVTPEKTFEIIKAALEFLHGIQEGQR